MFIIEERILICGVGCHIYTVFCGGLEHLKRGGWTKITKVDQKTRCDERLKSKTEGYTSRIHWVDRGTGTPKDRDEVKAYYQA